MEIKKEILHSVIKDAVTVCVPSYNHSQYIRETLQSIFRQTYQPLELIVIDDGSSDSSPEIIKRTLIECPFESKFVARPNRGLSNTINEALADAKGEYFAVIGSDDVWLADFLQHRVAQLKERPKAVLAYGDCYVINNKGYIVGCTKDWAKYDDGDVRAMLLSRYPPSSPTVLYRKSALDIHRWNPELLLEDYELYLRLCTLGHFAYEPTILSAWREHTTNTSKNSELMKNGVLTALNLNKDALKITKREIRKVSDNVKWSSIEGLIRSKQRVKAVAEIIRCLPGDFPVKSKFTMFLKVLLPLSIVDQRRKRKYVERENLKNIRELMS